MRFAQPGFLWALLVVLPAVVGLLYWSWRVKQNLIRQFIRDRLLASLTVGLQPRRQIFRLGLLVAAIAAALLALARPQWGYVWEESHVKGLDIIIAMDTSRSMLAQDVVPNRLDRAKYAAFDLMRLARTDRLGLIAFAGTAFLQSPLTLDDQAFRQGVEALNVGIIPQGGTALSAAIKTAQQAFEKNNENHKVLVLFTDGEDHDQEGETIAAAKDAAQAGIHIFTVGVGTRAGQLLQTRDEQGNYTTIKDEDGNPVISHLNETLLRQIATDANGFYLPLQGANTMETLYARGLAPLPRSETTARRTRVYQERYHWLLLFSFACLLAEFLMPESARRARRAESKSTARSRELEKAAAAVIFLLVSMGTQASPTSAYHDYQAGDFKQAYEEYNRLSEKDTNDYRLHYDAGAAAYKAKQLDKAEKQFMATLGSPSVAPDVQTQERTYYNLGNTEYRLGEPMTEADKKQERWQQAIDSYTQALRLNTNDLDARNNLIFVKRKLEELKQQQQQQNKQNKNKQDQNKDKNQQQQQQQSKQNQQDKNKQDQQQQQQQQSQQQQSGQDRDKQQEQQQQQAQRDKDKQEQQQAQAGHGDEKDKEKREAEQAAAEGRMTPDEARQILAEQKDEEKALIFAPDNTPPPPAQSGRFKDW
jgi:Ca-activated chloride channel family protein